MSTRFAKRSALIALLALVCGASAVHAETYHSKLVPVAPVPGDANRLVFTARLLELGLQANGTTRLEDASFLNVGYDAGARSLTIANGVFDGTDVALLGVPLTQPTIGLAAATAAVSPSTGAFTVPNESISFSGCILGGCITGYQSLSLPGTLTLTGPQPLGPVSLRITAAVPIDVTLTIYIGLPPPLETVTVQVTGTLYLDLVSEEPVLPDGVVRGSVAVPGSEGPRGIDDAWVGMFGYETTTRGGGRYTMPAWPSQPNPSWLYAGMQCGSSWAVGRSDLVAWSPTAIDFGTTFLRGEPGHFRAPEPIPTGAGVTEGVAAAHLDRDPYLDLAVAVDTGAASDRIQILRGTAAGGFTSGPSIDAQGKIAGELFASDGNQEAVIAYANPTQHAISVLFGYERGSGFAGPFHTAVGGVPRNFRAANITRAVGPDLFVVVAGEGSGDALVRVPSVSPGVWGAPQVLYTAEAALDAIEVADFSGDGFDDLVIGDAASAACLSFVSSGADAFAAPSPVACAGSPVGADRMDVDGDGDADVVGVSAAGGLSVLRSDAHGLAPTAAALGGTFAAVRHAEWMIVPSHVMVAASGSDATARIITDDGAGGWTQAATLTSTSNTDQVGSIAVGDFDRDGFDDVVGTTSSDHVTLWRNALVPADGDGDGLDDVRELSLGTRCDSRDSDADGAIDGSDSCPSVANPTQTDTDRDGVGDACDDCPTTSNADQVDTDHDGIGDACEPPLRAGHLTPRTGGTSSIALNLLSYATGTFDNKTSVIQPGGTLDVTFDARTSELTLQALSIAGSDVSFFPVLRIPMTGIQQSLSVQGHGPIDPATGAFSITVGSRFTATSAGTPVAIQRSAVVNGIFQDQGTNGDGSGRFTIRNTTFSISDPVLTSGPYASFQFVLSVTPALDFASPGATTATRKGK